MRNKIKISGYTKKVNYLGDISYRPFNTINNPIRYDSLFTSGNFSVIGNIDENVFKRYKGKEFSKYHTLQDLGISVDEIKEIYSKDKSRLKLNPQNLKSYAYFGSLREYMRVTLENIILNFPAAIVIRPFNKFGEYVSGFDGDTVYLSNIENPYLINYIENGSEVNNPLRDLTKTFISYVVTDGVYEAPVIEFTDLNSPNTFGLKVDGYEKLNVNNTLYLRPNTKEIEKFFLGLNDLGSELLNRKIYPKYTYKFNRQQYVEELGYYVEGEFKGTWPTSDGYNLDFDNGMYDDYVSELIDMCDEHDSEVSNIVVRQLVSTSILEFDTVPSYDIDNIVDDSQRIKTLLTLYGRSFDEQKKYIDSLKFANVITYDGIDNTPDNVISSIANSFGWGILNQNEAGSVVKDLLMKDQFSKNEIGYELTKEEIKKEIFKRLIINSPWLYKSKGTRKALDFFNEFFNIPDGLISFNEYIYRATNKIPYSDLREINNEVSIFKLKDDPGEYYTTEDGYPYIPANSDNVYFQMAGRWHQVTTGPDTNLEINDGNNPHLGPYDGGHSYWSLFKNLIPDFQPVNVVKTEEVVNIKNRYTETFEGFAMDQNVSGRLYNVNQQENFDVLASIKTTYPPKQEYDICGCEVNNTTRTLDISAVSENIDFNCDYDLVKIGNDKTFKFYLDGNLIEPTTECCSSIGGNYFYSYTGKGYVCGLEGYVDCNRYRFTEVNSNNLEVFYDQLNEINTTVVPSPECCTSFSQGIQVVDGYNCFRSVIIEDLCFTIKEINALDTLTQNFTIHYINSNTGRTESLQFSGFSGVKTTAFNVLSGTSITFNVDGVSLILTYSELIDLIGIVNSATNVSTTITVGGKRITLKMDFYECPEISYDYACPKGLDIMLVDQIGFSNSPINIGLYYNDAYGGVRNFTDSFSGIYYNIEENTQMISNFGDLITISLNNGVNSYHKGFRLKDYINYNGVEVGMVVSVNVELVTGLTIRFKFKLVDCVTCPQLDPVSEILIDNKYYVEFNNNGTLTNTVQNAACCPSNTIPESAGNNIYRCYLRDYLPEDCENELTTIVEGNVPNMTYVLVDGFTNVLSTATIVPTYGNILNDRTFVAPNTGVYEITIGAYGRHELLREEDNVTFYDNVDLIPYVNGVIRDEFYIPLTYYTGIVYPNMVPDKTTFNIELNAGDQLEFKNYFIAPSDLTYKSVRFFNTSIKISTVEVICGCETNLTATKSLIDISSDLLTNRPKYNSSDLIISENGNVVDTINLVFNNNETTPINTTINISSSTTITITNVDKLAEHYSGFTVNNGVLVVNGNQLMTMVNEYLSVVYLSNNSSYIVRFKFTPLGCDPKPLTISQNINNFNYLENKGRSITSNYIVKVTEPTTLRIIMNGYGSVMESPLNISLSYNNNTTTMVEYVNDVPLNTQFSGSVIKSKNVTNCGVFSDLFVKGEYNWTMHSAGTYQLDFSSLLNQGYCGTDPNNPNSAPIFHYMDDATCVEVNPQTQGNSFTFMGSAGVEFFKINNNQLITVYNDNKFCGITCQI